MYIGLRFNETIFRYLPQIRSPNLMVLTFFNRSEHVLIFQRRRCIINKTNKLYH